MARKIKHVGFKGAVRKLSKRYGKAAAARIIGAAKAHASKAAKRRNPRLKRVGGKRRRKRR